jgi:hypothetical protein
LTPEEMKQIQLEANKEAGLDEAGELLEVEMEKMENKTERDVGKV